MLCSCIAKDFRQNVAISAGVLSFMYVLQMLANMGGSLENVKYFTFFTTFQPEKLIEGTFQGVFAAYMLLIAGFVLFGSAITFFKKRDLSV